MRFASLLLLAGFVLMLFGCQKEILQPENLGLELQNAKSGTNTSTGLKFGTMKDIDGNTYKTIQIGRQVWMAENLRVSKYRNGNPISNITDGTEWINASTGAWCNYNNDVDLNSSYGKLYNWNAVNDSRGLAPRGWHIPTASEVNTLIEYLGGASVAGGKMKEKNTFFWATTSNDVTNSSGFSARGGGYRVYNGVYSDIKYGGIFWTSSATDLTNAGIYALGHSTIDVATGGWSKIQGISVRCVKD